MSTILKLNVMEDKELRADLKALFLDVAKSVAREEINETVKNTIAYKVEAMSSNAEANIRYALSNVNVTNIVAQQAKLAIDLLMANIAVEARIAAREYIKSAEMVELIKSAAIKTVQDIMMRLVEEEPKNG